MGTLVVVLLVFCVYLYSAEDRLLIWHWLLELGLLTILVALAAWMT